MSGAKGRQSALPNKVEWDELDKSRFYFFGPLLNVCTRAALYPAKVVKTRLQVQRASGASAQYTGTVHAFQKIWRHEGLRAFYRGFLPDCMALATSQLYITTFEVLRARSVGVIPSQTGRDLFAGLAASFASQSLMVPFEIVSQRQMVATGAANAESSRALAARIWKTSGLRGFYKGYWASILTFGPTSGIWWATYGAVRRLQLDYVDTGDSYARLVMLQASAGASAGVFAASITNPIDVIRARVQTEERSGSGSRGMAHMCRRLVEKEGYAGFLKGIYARAFHTGTSSVLLIVSYEFLKRLSRKADPET